MAPRAARMPQRKVSRSRTGREAAGTLVERGEDGGPEEGPQQGAADRVDEQKGEARRHEMPAEGRPRDDGGGSGGTQGGEEELSEALHEIGGSAWESNPPPVPQPARDNGFEDRKRHQPLSASAPRLYRKRGPSRQPMPGL